MMQFKSLDHIKIPNGRWIKDNFVVENPRNCDNFEWIIGKDVTIDGREYTVIDVERFAHAAPWKKGDKIGLLCESWDTQPIE